MEEQLTFANVFVAAAASFPVALESSNANSGLVPKKFVMFTAAASSVKCESSA